MVTTSHAAIPDILQKRTCPAVRTDLLISLRQVLSPVPILLCSPSRFHQLLSLVLLTAVNARRQARLIPAVERFCYAQGFPYERLADKGTGHVGVIEIYLRHGAPLHDSWGDTSIVGGQLGEAFGGSGAGGSGGTADRRGGQAFVIR